MFPNLRLCYLSSRTYAGYASPDAVSPEPQAYENGFSVKWLIENQINGDPELNFDPASGPVRAPLLLWGPYLWADGVVPRGDGLTWLEQDFENDRIHPSRRGEQKVADLLSRFFAENATTRPWWQPNRDIALADLDVSDDASVRSASPDQNFGSDPILSTAPEPSPVHSFLRFDARSIFRLDARVLYAKLSLRVEDRGGDDVTVVSDSEWKESELTFDEAPLIDGVLLASLPTATKDSTIAVDVTSALKADDDKVLTLALTSNQTEEGVRKYHSKEGGQPPRLIVGLSAPADCSRHERYAGGELIYSNPDLGRLTLLSTESGLSDVGFLEQYPYQDLEFCAECGPDLAAGAPASLEGYIRVRRRERGPATDRIGHVALGLGGTGAGFYENASVAVGEARPGQDPNDSVGCPEDLSDPENHLCDDAQDTVARLVDAGYETYQVNHQQPLSRDGRYANAQGLGWTQAFCTYALAARWIAETQRGSDEPLCATGNSGGSFEIAYGLAYYDLDAVLDAAVMTGGPFHRWDLHAFAEADCDPADPCPPGALDPPPGFVADPEEPNGLLCWNTALGCGSVDYFNNPGTAIFSCPESFPPGVVEGPACKYSRPPHGALPTWSYVRKVQQPQMNIVPGIADLSHPFTRIRFVVADDDPSKAQNFAELYKRIIETSADTIRTTRIGEVPIGGLPHDFSRIHSTQATKPGSEQVTAYLRETCVEAHPGDDHFKCYKVRGSEFEQRTVKLVDQFGTTQTEVIKPAHLCNPVDKNDEGISDPTTHLTCYKIRDDVRFDRRSVAVKNQFSASHRRRTPCRPISCSMTSSATRSGDRASTNAWSP
jgi:hypothetical protein